MKPRSLLLLIALAGSFVLARAEPLAPEIQAKIDARIAAIATWAADPVIVDAVRAQNSAASADYTAMTQEKWRALTVLDPFVRSFSKNAAGQFLKSKRDDVVTEAFLSAANGWKVACIAKPTNWSHKGKDKHDVPMSGKNWQGPVELDESSGQQQVQVAVPVLDGGKPIGSLVVGLSLSKIKS